MKLNTFYVTENGKGYEKSLSVKYPMKDCNPRIQNPLQSKQNFIRFGKASDVTKAGKCTEYFQKISAK